MGRGIFKGSGTLSGTATLWGQKIIWSPFFDPIRVIFPLSCLLFILFIDSRLFAFKGFFNLSGKSEKKFLLNVNEKIKFHGTFLIFFDDVSFLIRGLRAYWEGGLGFIRGLLSNDWFFLRAPFLHALCRNLSISPFLL